MDILTVTKSPVVRIKPTMSQTNCIDGFVRGASDKDLKRDSDLGEDDDR